MKIFFFLLTLFPYLAHGSLPLKKVEGKSAIHQMENIDFIYLINLDERPEKYQLCVEQLSAFAIHPYRFSAVNGWKLSLEELETLGVRFDETMQGGIWGTYYPIEKKGKPQHTIISEIGKTYFCHSMSRGAIGIVLSHLSILQDAYDSGYQTIWVMEDDIQIIENPHLLSLLISQLDAAVGKGQWDILFTDRDTKDQLGNYVACMGYAKRPNFEPANPGIFQLQQDINPLFRRIGARYGAYSMILRRSGIEKILHFLKCHAIFLPYDMEYTLIPGIKLFTVQNDIISTLPAAFSDNGAPNYLTQ